MYGFDSSGYALLPTYRHWEYCAAVWGDPMKFVKYKLASFFSFHHSQELPISPLPEGLDLPGVLLGGRAYRFARYMGHAHIEYYDSLVYSVLMSKKGMPRPNRIQVRKAEAEAFVKLTTPISPREAVNLIPWADITPGCPSSSVLSRSNVISEILRTVEELYKGQVGFHSYSEFIRPFFPSTSSNYVNSRALGGCVGAILDHPDLLKGLKSEQPLVELSSQRVGNGEVIVSDTSRLQQTFLQFFDRLCKAAHEELVTVKLLGLPEALKTRVISKGPPLHYTALKPLQKLLWRVLRDHPAFRLVGEPITTEYLTERLGSSKPLGVREFLSVDYADATNEMFSWCSDAAVDSLVFTLSLKEEIARLFRGSMTGHTIEHVIAVENSSGLPQQRGQLMGSVVSFPILCIVNAAICRWALELDQNRKFTLADARLCVNGDDAAMVIGPKGHEIWKQIAAFCGLTPSTGNVYFSSEFVNMNSRNFVYHPAGYLHVLTEKGSWKVDRFAETPFVNMGLLLGLKRSGGTFDVSDTTMYQSLGSRARDLVQMSPGYLRERVLGQFIHVNLSKLKKFSPIPWFIPESLGGFGLPTIGRYKPTLDVLKLARKAYLNPQYMVVVSPPPKEWKVWNYVQRRLRPFDKPSFYIPVWEGMGASLVYPTRNDSFTHLYEELSNYLCVEALFTVDGIRDLYEAKGKHVGSVVNAAYRKSANEWRRCQSDNFAPFFKFAPFDAEHLPKNLRFHAIVSENHVDLGINDLERESLDDALRLANFFSLVPNRLPRYSTGVNFFNPTVDLIA